MTQFLKTFLSVIYEFLLYFVCFLNITNPTFVKVHFYPYQLFMGRPCLQICGGTVEVAYGEKHSSLLWYDIKKFFTVTSILTYYLWERIGAYP
jgi:hypothetical protein